MKVYAFVEYLNVEKSTEYISNIYKKRYKLSRSKVYDYLKDKNRFLFSEFYLYTRIRENINLHKRFANNK